MAKKKFNIPLLRNLLLGFCSIVLFACQDNDVKKEIKHTDHYKDSIQTLILLSKKASPKEAKALLNKAILLSKENNNDSFEFKILSRFAIVEYKSFQYEKFKEYSLKIIELSLQKKDSSFLAKGYYNLGSYYSKTNKIDSAYYYFNEAETVYSILGDSTKTGSSLLNMAIIQTGVGDYQGSEETTINALSFFKNNQKTKTVCSLYNNLGVLSYELKQYSDALYWYEQALILTKRENAKAVILNNIGIIHRDLEHLKQAKIFFQKALEIPLDSYPNILAMVLDNLGYIELLEKNPNAIKKLKRALTIRDTLNNNRGQIVSKLHIADYYLYKGDTLAALKLLNNTLSQAKKSNDLKNKLKILLMLSKVSTSEKYLQRYLLIKDSVNSLERNYKYLFAKIRYRTQKQENKFEFLQSKFNNQTANLESQKVKKKWYGSLLIASLILILIGLFLNIQRRKIHKQQLLIEKLKARAKEKQSISVFLHDSIAGDILLGLQQSQTIKEKINLKEFDSLITIFERAYEKARKISQDLNQHYFHKTKFKHKILNLCTEYSFNTGIKVTSLNLESIPWNQVQNEIKISLFEILKETLNNILKHAKASSVSIAFYKKEKFITIDINDDGIGIDKKKTNEGIGLLNIKERVTDLEGTITFNSIQPKGTQIKITIPLLYERQ